MAYPADDSGGAPRSLKPEDTKPAVPQYDPSVPKGFSPVSKEDAQINADTAKYHYEQWRSANLQANTPVKVTSGVVYRWEEGGGSEGPPASVVAAGEDAVADWYVLHGDEGGGSSGKWVPDPNGQMFYDDWQSAIDETKQKFDSLGTARSYADIEAPKSKEIARQFQDFENRATLLYDLMADEQQYGMRADDQNIQNMSAQQELGLGGVPGGFYAKQPMSSALSNILAPSLPGYVRPDYRLNQSVGLPGPQGFDDQDYNQFGFPAFAYGTDPMPIQVPPIQIRTWPWGGR